MADLIDVGRDADSAAGIAHMMTDQDTGGASQGCIISRRVRCSTGLRRIPATGISISSASQSRSEDVAGGHRLWQEHAGRDRAQAIQGHPDSACELDSFIPADPLRFGRDHARLPWPETRGRAAGACVRKDRPHIR